MSSSAGLSSWIYASFRRTKRRFQRLQRPARYSFEPLDGAGCVSSAESALLPGVVAAASSSPRDSLDVDDDDDVHVGIANRGGSGAGGSRPDSVADAGGIDPVPSADGVASSAPSAIKYDAMMESEPSSPTAAADGGGVPSLPPSPSKSPFRKRNSKPLLSLRKKKKSESPPAAAGKTTTTKKSSSPSSEKSNPASTPEALASDAGVVGSSEEALSSQQQQLVREKDEEVERLEQEVTALKMELRKSEENYKRLAQREKILQDRLAAQALHVLEKSGKFENINSAELRPSQIVTMFQELYSQGRVDALDALDELDELEDFDDLKMKILYSVIVLAYRAAKRTLDNLKAAVKNALQLPDASAFDNDDDDDVDDEEILVEGGVIVNGGVDSMTDSTRNRRWLLLAKGVEDSAADWLRKTAKVFELTACLEEVEEQLHATLFDFPSLKACQPLKEFIRSAIRASWCCVVQNPPFTVEYQLTEFKPECHQRFISADPDLDRISSYVWPGLFEEDSGVCLVKGVVIT